MFTKASVNALFLLSDFTGYYKACLDYLTSQCGTQLMIVRKQRDPNAPFQLETNQYHSFIEKNELPFKFLASRCQSFNPQIVFVSGWNDKEYLKLCQSFINISIPVVLGLDNHWKGTLKQRLGIVYSRLFFHRYFTHIWVAGYPQYEFARRLGFKFNNIIDSLLSADVYKFSTLEQDTRRPIVRQLLYVGRFVPVKNLIQLYTVFNELSDEERNEWTLRMIGNGELKAILKPIPGKIEVESFKSPDELAKLSQEAGAFCLPSVKEPWGVVVHEFAALGIPLLLSDIVGASKTFLIPGYNGFSFKVGNAASLRRELICFFHLSEQEIREMGNRSKKLSQLITPELWAYKFLSVLYQE